MDVEIPLSFPDLCLGALVGVFALVGTLVIAARSPERVVILAAAAMKMVYSFLSCVLGVMVYYGGDMHGYHEHGVVIAERIRADFPHGLMRYLEDTPFFLLAGSNTVRIQSLSGLAHFLTFDSYVGSSILLAMVGFVGQVLIYRTFAGLYPDARVRNWWRVGILFPPSFNIWSSGLLKDTPGLFGLGCAFWGLHQFLSGYRVRHLAAMVFGLYVLLLFPEQVVPVFLIAAFPLLFGTVTSRTGAPSRLPRAVRRSVGIVVVLAVCAVAMQFQQRFSLSKSVLDELAHSRQAYAERVAGYAGSTVVDRDEEVEERSGLAVLAKWPEAFLTALYRPFPWEGLTSATMFLASLENAVLLLLSLRLVFLSMNSAALAEAARTPVLLECLIFVAAFAFGIGFSTPNLGSISRYRIPMVPYFVGVVTIMEALRLRRRDRSQWLNWSPGGPGARPGVAGLRPEA